MNVLPRIIIVALASADLLLAGTAPVPKAVPDGKQLQQAVVPREADPGWRFSAGAQWREIGRADWHTGSLAAHTSLPWLAGKGGPAARAASLPSGQGDHNYDDGFVKEDSSGGAFGDTWYWGYNNPSQLQGTNLVFNSASGGGTQSSTSRSAGSSLGSSGWSDDLSGAGWFAKIESPTLLKIGIVRASVVLGYSFAQDDVSHFTPGLFRAWQQTRVRTRTLSVQDTYDTSGIIVPLAPYAGSFNNFGPLIPDTPASRSIGNGAATSRTQSAQFHSDVSEALHLRMHTISLGPNLSAEWKRLRFGLGFGLGLNIADWSASFDETLYGGSRVLQRFHRESSGMDVLPGFYLEPSVEFGITRRLGLYVSGRYDWARSLHAGVGPSSFDFNPGGWSLMGGLTFSL